MQINNPYLSYIFNKLDAPIRFAYCRLPFLHKMLFWTLYTSNYKKIDKRFMEMHEMLRAQKFDFTNKVCLELGPGNSYISAYNLLLLGAKKVILVDKYPRIINTKKQRAQFKNEIRYIKAKYKDVMRVPNMESLHKKIIFHTGELNEIASDHSVDFILSFSVLEHVGDMDKLFLNMSQALNERGYMYHHIDLRDHFNFSSPFLFYKYSQSTWVNKLTKEGISYTNRLRFNDYVELMSKYNFVIHKSILLSQPLLDIKVDETFLHRIDLNITEAKLLIGIQDGQ